MEISSRRMPFYKIGMNREYSIFPFEIKKRKKQCRAHTYDYTPYVYIFV